LWALHSGTRFFEWLFKGAHGKRGFGGRVGLDKVTFEEGILNIYGERRIEKEEKNRKYHRIEREHGRFLRSFSLRDNADATRIVAEFKKGVLHLRLPKNEKSHPKVLEVKITWGVPVTTRAPEECVPSARKSQGRRERPGGG
jgi:hypothetical protein